MFHGTLPGPSTSLVIPNETPFEFILLLLAARNSNYWSSRFVEREKYAGTRTSFTEFGRNRHFANALTVALSIWICPWALRISTEDTPPSPRTFSK